MKKDPSHVELFIRRYKLLFKPNKMVGWYNPSQLASTGIKTVVSSLFGSYADKREIMASINQGAPHDYSQHSELWFDYTADLGDGFNSTYTIARLLSKGEITLSHNGEEIKTKRGNLLLMGGDQVYPVASRENYNNRLIGPYNLAFPSDKQDMNAPHVYAIPGNHDWYDGLSNFVKIFCQQRSLGNWRTQQHRSYFAIKLSESLWLWGIDIQLDADIDKPQLEYFGKMSSEMKDGDRVVLCTAEPSWVYNTCRPKDMSYKNLDYFESEYIEKKNFELILTIAGDLHHFAHYSKRDGEKELHKITSGGGGAFLHPTHNLPESLNVREGDFQFTKAYPERSKCRGLLFRNLLFPITNWSFAAFMGTFYLLVAWILQTSTKNESMSFLESLSTVPPEFCKSMWYFGQILDVVMFSPFLVMLMLVIVSGLYAFADKGSGNEVWSSAFGVIHGLTHLALNFTMLWIFSYINFQWFGIEITTIEGVSLFAIEMFFIGGGVGSMIMGIYLILSNLLLGVHDNEAFSSIKWEDNKHFLRMRLTAKELTIYPIAVDRTTRWKRKGNYFEGQDAVPHLIEEPIRIKL